MLNIPVKSCFPRHSCTSWKNPTLRTTVTNHTKLDISANFKKVSQLASSSPLITPSVDIINECVSHLVDTHPVLVLQWCQVLRQLKYMDAQFWCGFIDTGTRLSTGKSYTSRWLRLIVEIQGNRCIVLILSLPSPLSLLNLSRVWRGAARRLGASRIEFSPGISSLAKVRRCFASHLAWGLPAVKKVPPV